jgi:putative DNA methylase
LIPRECKRLAEVDFPVAEVSKHSVREKSIRHGHPSTLHLWWARRPLAACRAMLMALLLPDPCDAHCPAEFKAHARRLLAPVPMVPLGPDDADLRKALLKFIADFANWDNSANPTYLECARGLVKAAHGQEPPLVVDPFAGGGSIPLEALRVGCDAFASDLNPVACLILKVLLEDIPRHGPGLADELRRVGREIKEAAEKELAEFYPPDPDGARPIAYLWARTVRCEAVGCGAEIPLMRSFWLCRKANRRRALKLVHERDGRHPKDRLNELTSGKGAWRFEIFEPKSEVEVRGGTVARGNATCPCCKAVLPVARVRAQLAAQRGGADAIFDANGMRVGGARLLAVVTLSDEEKGRSYRPPNEMDYEAVHKAQCKLQEILDEWNRLPAERRGISPIPDERLPPIGTLGFRVQRYGMPQWGDLFTARQKLALRSLCAAMCLDRTVVPEAASFALGKLTDLSNALCGWIPQVECPSAVFKLGRVKMTWDFVEGATLRDSSGSYSVALDNLIAGMRSAETGRTLGQVSIQKAQWSPLSDESAGVWFTDPPYYDAIPYSDLADFFFVWLKRALPGHSLLRDPFDATNPLTPKEAEAVQDVARLINGRPKDRWFFEEAMAVAFAEGRRILSPSGIGSVVFAHKTTEGWEALLSGMIRGGWAITGSWPIGTEMGHRIRARESAALATSVHLVCRPRPENAGIGGWEDILRELPNRIGNWMERLSGEGIRGADLVFSCIGPALELYSKYDKVVDAQDREIPLGGDPKAAEAYKRGFLAYIWEIVGRVALQQVLGTAEARARNSAAGALEEDARLTALFLWTLQSTNGGAALEGAATSSEDEEEEAGAEDEDEEGVAGKPKKGFTLIYDVVRRFAQPLGIHLGAWDGRIIEVKKGVVRLLPVLEREEQLFGTSGVAAVARTLERTGGRDPQYMLFPEQPEGRPAGGRKPRRSRAREEAEARAPRREATTLDRVHAAMLLQARGEATALRALLEAESERSPDFLRLANALSALYPKDSEEKRLLDAMLLAAPRS